MSRTRAEVKIGDCIYIYKIFGYSEYNESTGVVSLITEDNYSKLKEYFQLIRKEYT